MKRKRILRTMASVIIAALMLLGVGIAQARWIQIAGIYILPEKVCTDGAYVGVAASYVYTDDYYDLDAWSNGLLASTTLNIPFNFVGTPPMYYPGNPAFHSVRFSVLRWTQPLTPGRQIAMTLSSHGKGEHFPIYPFVDSCSLKDFPGGTIVHICSNDVPRGIVTSTTSSLLFPENLHIEDVDVQMYITHTWDSDVIATLVSPDGTSDALFSGVGADGDNFGTTKGEMNINPDFYLDDEGAQFFTNTVSPFTDTFGFVPQNPLSTFDRKSALGLWTLQLTDTFPSADDGRLFSWCLNVNGYYVNNLPVIFRSP